MKWSIDDIKNNGFIYPKINSKSHSRTRYHLYLCNSKHDFLKLSTEEKNEFLFQHSIAHHDNESMSGDDTDDDDRTMHSIFQISKQKWATEENEVKQYWKAHAKSVNEQEIHGLFDIIPRELDESSYEEVLRKSLQYSWSCIMRWMYNAMISR